MNVSRRTLLWAPVLAAARGAGAQQVQTGGEPLVSLWQWPLRRVVEVAVAVDGSRVIAVDREGWVLCFSRSGQRLWRQSIPNTERVIIARDGLLALAYGVRNPHNCRVTFLDRRGRRFARVDLNEPPRYVAVAPDGGGAAIAAGSSVVLCSRTPEGIRTRVVDVPGAPAQIAVGPNGGYFVALQSPPEVRLIRSDGSTAWKRTTPGARACSVSSSTRGKHVAVAVDGPDEDVSVTLLTEHNRTLWSATRPGRFPKIRLSPDGSTTILSYEHRLDHEGDRRFERKLSFLPTGGTTTWTKGGAYTSPLGLGVTDGGAWVTALDARADGNPPRLRLFSREGVTRYSLPFLVGVLIATSSADGRCVAAYRQDGVLELFELRLTSETTAP